MLPSSRDKASSLFRIDVCTSDHSASGERCGDVLEHRETEMKNRRLHEHRKKPKQEIRK